MTRTHIKLVVAITALDIIVTVAGIKYVIARAAIQ